MSKCRKGKNKRFRQIQESKMTVRAGRRVFFHSHVGLSWQNWSITIVLSPSLFLSCLVVESVRKTVWCGMKMGALVLLGGHFIVTQIMLTAPQSG